MPIGPTLANKSNQRLKWGRSREVAQGLMKQWIINISMQRLYTLEDFHCQKLGVFLRKKLSPMPRGHRGLCKGHVLSKSMNMCHILLQIMVKYI